MGVLSPTPTPFPVHHRHGRTARLTSVPQGLVLVGGDVLTLALALLLTGEVFGLPLGPGGAQATVVWGSVWIIWRAYQGLYPGYGRSPQTELRIHVVGTLQLAAVQLASALAVQRLPPSVGGVLLEWTLILILGLLIRYGFRFLLIRAAVYGRPISVIGAGQTALQAIVHLKANPAYGLNPVAAYDDNVALHGGSIGGVPVLGAIELALTEPRTEQALISIPGARAEVQQRVVNSIFAVFPYTWVIPDLIGVPNQALQPHNIGSFASLEVRNNLRITQARVLKRLIDVVGAAVGGIVVLPVLLLIAVAVVLDSPGPPVYRARRLGRDGRSFDCFKFRSMHRDADEKLRVVLDADPVLRREFEATHKLKSDPRVTRVGTFLRRTSLDELPQLANVLLGTMSLVGPRPIVGAEVEKYADVYGIYKQVRPGITGYWQVNGRSDTTYDERVGMDKFYITNWTPWLDLVILLRTVAVVLRGRGAY